MDTNVRFTPQNVDGLRRPIHKRKHIEWDEALPGFGLQFDGDAKPSYFVKLQIHYRTKILQLGRIDTIRFDHAKRIADGLLTICAFAEQRIQNLKRKNVQPNEDERQLQIETTSIFQPTRILRFRELASVHGIVYSRRHLLRLEEEGKFPNRVRIGERLVGWVSAEIEEYLHEKLDERDAEIGS